MPFLSFEITPEQAAQLSGTFSGLSLDGTRQAEAQIELPAVADGMALRARARLSYGVSSRSDCLRAAIGGGAQVDPALLASIFTLLDEDGRPAVREQSSATVWLAASPGISATVEFDHADRDLDLGALGDEALASARSLIAHAIEVLGETADFRAALAAADEAFRLGQSTPEPEDAVPRARPLSL